MTFNSQVLVLWDFGVVVNAAVGYFVARVGVSANALVQVQDRGTCEGTASGGGYKLSLLAKGGLPCDATSLRIASQQRRTRFSNVKVYRFSLLHSGP